MLTGVGVAGCGRMGAPMLAALRAAKFDARGFDICAPSNFGDLTPAMTDQPTIFARGLRILITVVRDVDQTEDVLFGAQRFVKIAENLEQIIISSTLSPRYVRNLRARVPGHIRMVDAPMSGAQVAAHARQLTFMLGGAADNLDRMQPLFDAMGRHFHRMGEFGNGMSAKVLNNLLAASNTAMTRLVLDWADQLRIEEHELLSLIHTSSGQNWFASGFDEIEFSRDGHAEDNTIGILVKDIESALDAAPDGADTALPKAVQSSIRALKPRSR